MVIAILLELRAILRGCGVAVKTGEASVLAPPTLVAMAEREGRRCAVIRCRRALTVLLVLAATGLLSFPDTAPAQPGADQVLTDVGLSARDRQRVLNGEFVTANVAGVSERSLSFAIAFLVTTSPEALSQQVVAGTLIRADAQVQAHGGISDAGSLADFAGLTITNEEARALAQARPGRALNLSAAEIAAFRAVPGGTREGIQRELQRMLLARYQAYRASGLGGIAPFDRGGGRTADLAADLRRASEATPVLERHLPAFRTVLLGYPQATLPEMRENFFWVKSVIQGNTTYVLTHVFKAPEGAACAVARRQFYASTGYNGEQLVGGFLPVPRGTVVFTVSHAFTDQVTGIGGAARRSIGSRVMAGRMREIFEAGRQKAGR